MQRRFTRPAGPLVLLTALVLSLMLTSPGWAGISGENVIVVVNGDSTDSRTLANHYVQLREIPSCNVVVLSNVPQGRRCDLDVFKNCILQPILQQIDARRLAPQIKVIAYSAGFPLAVNVKRHQNRLKDAGLKRLQSQIASLTGLTYFYHHILADAEGYLGLGSNLYCRQRFARNFLNPFSGGKDRETFQEATANRREGEFIDAAEKFQSLLKKHPLQAPLGVLAAECYAEQGDFEASAKLLISAIESGWTSGSYLSDASLLQSVLARPELKKALDSLQQFPRVCQEPVEFSSQVFWALNGWPSTDPDNGVRHLMACMLAVVDPRGSSLDQAVRVLRVAASSDIPPLESSNAKAEVSKAEVSKAEASKIQASSVGSSDAEFWFSKTNNVRTKTRMGNVPDALAWLDSVGKTGRIVPGNIPDRPGAVAGLMLGTAGMNLARRPWRFVPGAIADNLTSHSGNFERDAQTKITELLHCGVAMTSGSVAEPFAVQQKFPLPLMYGFYASGSSAIESFYLSIASPYQTLIVGDPITTPFAVGPPDRAGFKKVENKDEFLVGWKPRPLTDPQTHAVATELYMGGKLMRRARPERTKKVQVNDIPAGWWPLRLTLLSRAPMRPRSVHDNWVQFGDSATFPIATPMDQSVRVFCAGASTIVLLHHERSIGKIEGFEGTIEVDPKQWGSGPVRVRPVAVVDGKKVYGKSVVVNVR